MFCSSPSTTVNPSCFAHPHQPQLDSIEILSIKMELGIHSFFRTNPTNFLRRFQTEQNDFLGRIITSDETWVYSWDPETKRQSAEWRDFDEPRQEKVRRKQGALKVMHMIFFDMNGVILRWPVPIGTTINAQYYKKVLQDKLKPAIRKKRPGLLESGILFHHDNAPVHTARAVRDVLAGYKWELLGHPRYSPDLAPSGITSPAISSLFFIKRKLM
ncbi:hypothetical protein RRG08_022598 [Elysia crispata]|uniref:Transposase n=1 Tax=Elysia crispata TaxID=231223 RepID=A0AAE0Z1J3_9GAST|nr:hypothetical protein RRG08_022598 [Elysia crispata]